MEKIKPAGHVFIDLDGTLIENKPKDIEKLVFTQAIINTFGKRTFSIEKKYNLFSQMNWNYLVQFLVKCKKYKGYGTPENFAQLLKKKNFFSKDSDLKIYIRFINEYLKQDQIHACEIKVYSDSKNMLESLKGNGYRLYLYSNWFKCVQKAKLQAHGFLEYFSSIYTIDDNYGKSSIKGWTDVLQKSNINLNELTIMVGNAASDIVPSDLEIPSLIRAGSKSKLVQEKGIIIQSMNEVLPFLEEEKVKRKTK